MGSHIVAQRVRLGSLTLGILFVQHFQSSSAPPLSKRWPFSRAGHPEERLLQALVIPIRHQKVKGYADEPSPSAQPTITVKGLSTSTTGTGNSKVHGQITSIQGQAVSEACAI